MRRRSSQLTTKDHPDESTIRQRRPRRGRLRWLALSLLALSLCVLGAPRLIGLSFVQQRLLARFASNLPGPIEIGRLQLTWLRPPQITDLQVRSKDGQVLLQVPTVRGERPLWQMVCDPNQLGVIHVDQPQLNVRVRPGGSNLEDYLAALPTTTTNSETGTQLQVQLHEGRVRLNGDGLAEQSLSQLQGWLDMPSTNTGLLTFAFQGVAMGAAAAQDDSGRVQMQGSWTAKATDGTGAPHGAVQINLKQLPLESSRYAQVRFAIPGHLQGAVSGHLQFIVHPDDAWPINQLQCGLEFTPLHLISQTNDWNNIELPTASFQLHANVREGLLQLDECQFTSQLATMSLNTSIAADLLADKADLLATLSATEFDLKGQLDLAELARQAPKAIRLRDDIQFESGTVRWNVLNQRNDRQEARLTGRLETAQLVARHGSEAVRLSEPIELHFRLGNGQQGPFAEELVLRAPSVHLEAVGHLTEGTVKCETDLTQLAVQLSQFLDLGSLQLSGKVSGAATWETNVEQDWQIIANVDADNLLIAHPDVPTWRDEHLQLRLAANGQFEDWQIHRIEAASFQFQSGADELLAQLVGAIDPNLLETTIPLQLKLVGDLSRWRSRLSWVYPESPPLSGHVDLQATTELSPTAIAFDPVRLELTDLQLTTGQRLIAEPRIEFVGQGHYDRSQQQLVLNTATLASTTASLKVDAFRSSFATMAPNLDGSVEFRGDLGRLWSHLDAAADVRPLGQWTGRAQIVGRPDRISVAATSQLEDFKWERRIIPIANRPNGIYHTVWQEPQVELKGSFDWWLAEGRLQINDASCRSTSLDLRVTGNTRPADRVQVDLTGTSRLKLDSLTARLRPWIGPQIQATGEIEQPFRISGPLLSSAEPPEANVHLAARSPQVPAPWVPAELAGEFGVGWQNLSAYGIGGGSGTLRAELNQQTLTIPRFQIPLSQGQLSLAPRIELSGPLRMTLEKGPVMERVSITPEMCRSWLKYIAPLVADAATGEGQFSIRVAQAQLPLQAPRRADVQGSMSIHYAHLGPGPLTSELLAVAQVIRTIVEPQRSGRVADATTRWVELPDQVFPFRIENGRVTHQNLTMQVGEVTIRTRGWVGFNQQLGIVAEVPVLDRWIAKRPELSGLKGQTLRLPIRGTLDHPTLDRRALGTLTKQAVTGAAEGLLRQELQRQLKDILPQ